jgi:chloramphenicol 3-O-phosphotransferase
MITEPTIIVLNGASSVGKTMIAQALIARLPQPTVLTGLDAISERVRPFGPPAKTHGQQVQRVCRI